MPRRIFEFECDEGTVSEKLVETDVLSILCECCGKGADRIISTPRVSLDGTDPSFPGEYMKWARKREQHLQQERKRNS